MKKTAFTFFFILMVALVSGNEPFRFRYFDLPKEICRCNTDEMNSFHHSIAEALEQTVALRRQLRPSKEPNEKFIQELGLFARRASTERAAIRQKANNEYRLKIETLHFRLANAHPEEKDRIIAKIKKEQHAYCRKFSVQQWKTLSSQIKRMKTLKPWIATFIDSKGIQQPENTSLTISDFDLYLLYLETLSKAFEHRFQWAEKLGE